MKKIFVTAIGGDIGCAVLKCLRDYYKEIYIIGCDITKYNAGVVFTNVFYIAPPYTNVKKYFEFIQEICIKEGITCFLPITEPEITIIDKQRDFFDKNNIKLMINNSVLLDIALSKYNTTMFLEKNNINVPKTWKGEDNKILTDIKFPLIVKNDQGCGSSKVKTAHNEIELNNCIKEFDNPILQEYIGTENEEYTIGIFSDGNIVNSIAYRRKLRGMSIWVESVNNDELNKLCLKIAQITNLKGCINVQLRRHHNKFYIFEINPRISSTVGFRYKMGFIDIIWWFELLEFNSKELNYNYDNDYIGVKTYDEVIFIKD